MKTFGFSGSILLLSIACISAQQAPAPTPLPVLTATNNLQRIFGPTAVYEGVLPEIKRRGGIFAAPDLRAPVVPGREFHNVSVHPLTGHAQGIVLFAVRF